MTDFDLVGDLPTAEQTRGSPDTSDLRRLLSALLQQLEEDGELKLSSSDARRSFAERIYRTRRLRSEFFPETIFRDPAWDIMVFLYVRGDSEKGVSVSAVCASAGTSHATGLRWVNILEGLGLVARLPHPSDRRTTWLRLTDLSRGRLDSFFDQTLKGIFGHPSGS